MSARPENVRTWIEVSSEALKNNYQEFRKLLRPECKLLAVCKSNAYGHGLVDYAKAMAELGADWLGVDSIVEAETLRESGIGQPILVLGYTLPEKYESALQDNISLTISSLESLQALKRFFADIQNDSDANLLHDSCFKIHLKLDTGMHRQGFQLEEFEAALQYIRENLPEISLEGLYTHFAAAKNPAFPADTNSQLAIFHQAIDLCHKYGLSPICHAAATAGTIVFPESHFDMVRVGIGLMGLWPSHETKAAFEDKISLRPALTWKTIVAEIKTIKAGQAIGYDFTEKLEKDTLIAILPVGYWHGYRRALSSISRVFINGNYAKILGRVSMDMIVVDATDIEGIKVGDEVLLLNHQEKISAYELAKLADTSWYEIITQLNPLIKRIYI